MKNGWQSLKLVDLCDVFADGDWLESKDQASDGIRLIQTGNVGEGVYKDRAEKARYISGATFTRLRCTEIFEGDCLISRLPDPVGRSCILPESGERMITAVDCTIVRFNPKKLVPAFFNFYSQSDDYLSKVSKECTGTTRSRVSRSNLALTTIPVPTLPEQQRIVGFLDQAFESIATAKANAAKNLQNARALFKSHLQTVFARRGPGWVEKTIGDVSILRSGTTLPKEIEKTSGQIPYLKVADMNISENLNGVTCSSRYVNKQDVNVSNLLPAGTTIFPKRGGAILTNKKRFTERVICADLNIMGVTPKSDLLPKFLFNFFLGLDLREISNGSSIPQINNYSIEPLLISFPKLTSEQKAIVEQLESLSEKTQRLACIYERKLVALEALKKSLLHQAFTGKL
jgi:type I restriction enzyme, S subunit